MRYLKWFINSVFALAITLVLVNVYTYYIKAETSPVENALSVDSKITKKSIYLPFLLNMHAYESDHGSLASTIFEPKIIFKKINNKHFIEDIGMSGAITQIYQNNFRKNRFAPFYTLYFDKDPDDSNGLDTAILNVYFNLTNKTVNDINNRIVKNKEPWRALISNNVTTIKSSFSVDTTQEERDNSSLPYYVVTFDKPLTLLEAYDNLLFTLTNDKDVQIEKEKNFMHSLANDRGYKLYKNDTWLIGFSFFPEEDQKPDDERYLTAVAISYRNNSLKINLDVNQITYYQR